jgi:transposase InsO family protein
MRGAYPYQFDDNNPRYDENGVRIGMVEVRVNDEQCESYESDVVELHEIASEAKKMWKSKKNKSREAKIIVQLVNGGTRNYNVLIDTGSDISTVRPEIVKELGMAIKPPERLRYLGMADPSHQVERIGTVELLLEVKFLSGNRNDVMMEKQFEVMNGSYDFLFGVDVIPELYPEQRDFFLRDMFTRTESPLLSPPKIYTNEEKQRVNATRVRRDANGDVRQVNSEFVNVCRVEIEREEEEELSTLYNDATNEQPSTMAFGIPPDTYYAFMTLHEMKKLGMIGPGSYPAPELIEQLKKTIIPMEKDVYLDDAFQTIRNQLLEDGIGTELTSQLPDRPEASTPATTDETYKKHRERIEKKLKPLIEKSEKCEGYCTHPMSKITIEMKKDLDVNELAQPQYKVGYSLWSAVTENIIRWLEKEKVEPGDNACKVNNPLLPVPRKDEKGTLTAVRTCLDLRKHNLMLVTDDKFELPNIPEMLRKLGQKSIFAELDLSEAFTQFEVVKASRKYLTFRWMGYCFQFRCMPFGWKPAPGVFQRAIITILADLPFVHAFIDNLSIASDSFEEHEKHIEAVINRLLEWNLKLKPGATKICHSQLKILGHLINKEGIGMDPTKVMTVKTWELPKDLANLRAFLGFAGFLADHVRHFADIAAPLYEVKNKEGELVWTSRMVESFNLLKKAIVAAPWLKHPDFTKPFVIATDASAVGVGNVLYQPEPDDTELIMTSTNIVAIYSHKFTETQRRYSTYKKELYAIVMGLQRFHQYVFLRKFTVITDHKPLEYLLTNKDIPVSLQQWTDVLLNYQFTIKHRPGVLHVLPDALSRMYENAYDENSTWGVGSRERLREVADKILPPTDKVDMKTFEANLTLSKAEVDRLEKKALRTAEENMNNGRERTEILLVECEEDADNNTITMTMQQLRDDSAQAGPLLCSVIAHLDINNETLDETTKRMLSRVKTHDETMNEVIKAIDPLRQLSVHDIATHVRTIEMTNSGIEVESDDESTQSSSSSSSSNSDDMNIERNANYDNDDKSEASVKKKKKPLTEEQKLLVAMELKGLKAPPVDQRENMVKKQHEKDHFGRDLTYDAIVRRGHWWPGMRRDIEQIIADCDRCLTYTIATKRYHPARRVMAKRPGDHYVIDVLTLPMSRRGYTKLLVLIDVLTRFGVFWALRNESAEEIARVMLRIFSFLGPCKILQSDNGPSFTNEVITAFNNLLRIHHRLITAYHPEANGIVERPNLTVIRMFQKFLEGEGADWPEFAPYLQIVYNDHVARNSGQSMFFLMMGREMNEFQDYRGERPLNLDDIDDTMETVKENWNKMLSIIYPAINIRQEEVGKEYIKKLDKTRRLLLQDPLPIGTLVMVRDHRWILNPAGRPKLASIYYPSKYKIIGNSHGAYTLESVDDGQVLDRKCTIDMLKRITGPLTNTRYRDVQADESYEVEEILDMKMEEGVLKYLLKWKGYKKPTWEPASNVSAPLVVSRWRKKQEEKYQQADLSDDERAMTKKRINEMERAEMLARQREEREKEKSDERYEEEKEDLRKLAQRRRQYLDAVPVDEDRETEQAKTERLERRLRRENKSGKEENDDE